MERRNYRDLQLRQESLALATILRLIVLNIAQRLEAVCSSLQTTSVRSSKYKGTCILYPLLQLSAHLLMTPYPAAHSLEAKGAVLLTSRGSSEPSEVTCTAGVKMVGEAKNPRTSGFSIKQEVIFLCL